MSLNDAVGYWPTLANLKYPAPVQNAITEAEAVLERFANAETERMVAEQNLNDARAEHTRLVKEAAHAGEPYPGELDTRPLEGLVEYAVEVERARRSDLSKAMAAISASIRAHRVAIARLAIEKANKGVDEYRATLAKINAMLNDANDKRREAYAGLTMLENYTKPEMQFRADLTNRETVQIPVGHERNVLNAIHALEAFVEAHSTQ